MLHMLSDSPVAATPVSNRIMRVSFINTLVLRFIRCISYFLFVLIFTLFTFDSCLFYEMCVGEGMFVDEKLHSRSIPIFVDVHAIKKKELTEKESLYQLCCILEKSKYEVLVTSR